MGLVHQRCIKIIAETVINSSIVVEKQNEIAKKNGADMDAYVHACMVDTAYLQAENEDNYKKWK